MQLVKLSTLAVSDKEIHRKETTCCFFYVLKHSGGLSDLFCGAIYKRLKVRTITKFRGDIFFFKKEEKNS